MPKFENPVPPFENDSFKYEDPAVKNIEESPSEEQGEDVGITEEEFEKEEAEEEEVQRAVDLQKEELTREVKGKRSRFSGARGALGKAALAIAALFGQAKEAKPEETPTTPPSPSSMIKRPYSYGFESGTRPKGYYGPSGRSMSGGRVVEYGQKRMERGRVFTTSQGLADMLGIEADKVEDLGQGRFSVTMKKPGDKYERRYEVDQERLDEIADIKARYGALHGNTKTLARARAMENLRKDIKAAVTREKESVLKPKEEPKSSEKPEVTVEEKRTEKIEDIVKKATKSVKAPAKLKKDSYYEDSGAYGPKE